MNIGTLLIIAVVSFFIISIIGAILRVVIGGLIGSNKLHEKSKIINRIVISISTLFFILSTLADPSNELKIGVILVIVLSGFISLLFFGYSDLRKSRKRDNKKTNKYLWEDLLGSL